MFVLLLWMSISTVLLFFSFYSAFLLIFSACIWKVRKTNQYGKGPPAPFNLNCGREWREIATYMKSSFKYAWKKHCGSESLEGQVLTRPFSAVHGVPLWTHGLLLHSSVSRQIHRAEACPKKEALYQGMALSFQHHWPWRWGTGSWTETHHVVWGYQMLTSVFCCLGFLQYFLVIALLFPFLKVTISSFCT